MREGEFRISSGCAIACIFHENGQRESGKRISEAMTLMHERSNGLGGGFVGYGIYPQFCDAYALHIFYDDYASKMECEKLIKEKFIVKKEEEIPTKKQEGIRKEPIIWRYFVNGKNKEEEEEVVAFLFKVNIDIKGAYVFSCGKNMGVFKGVGYPEEIAAFYQLEEYFAYTWIAHGRYPTNTPGWWAGAHPFAMLDMALVHNGEISSYDANRRYIEMFGYPCRLLTDTEVITYMFDFMHRKKKMKFEECAQVLAAPFWSEIDKMEVEEKRYYTMIRRNLSSLLISGPFSIILGYENGVIALNDRCKLRALMVGKKDHCVYLASEESAIRLIQPELDSIEALDGGVLFKAEKKGGLDDEKRKV